MTQFKFAYCEIVGCILQMIAISPILTKLKLKSGPGSSGSPMQKIKFFNITYLYYYKYIANVIFIFQVEKHHSCWKNFAYSSENWPNFAQFAKIDLLKKIEL